MSLLYSPVANTFSIINLGVSAHMYPSYRGFASSFFLCLYVWAQDSPNILTHLPNDTPYIENICLINYIVYISIHLASSPNPPAAMCLCSSLYRWYRIVLIINCSRIIYSQYNWYWSTLQFYTNPQDTPCFWHLAIYARMQSSLHRF